MAVYYCAQFHNAVMNFGTGTLLILTESKHSDHTILQKPTSYHGHEGDSPEIECTVHSRVSAGEHSVYWLRHGPGESPPGIIYTHGDTNSQCSRSSETDSPTQSCVYKLPKTNLSLSDAGTYYCAVAVCGQILFGNGTDLKIEERCAENRVLIYSLTATLVLTMVLLFLHLVISVNKKRHICCSKCRESSESPSTDVQGEHGEDLDTLTYTAVSSVKKNNSKDKQKRKTDQMLVIYSSVRHPEAN
ncbi:uncharacterized protein [Hoplias malabaricus]|uniref:uncharacterized protein n=1 Tax=Hoplias malabaricus TaxID=27720 RepID=UPI0034627C1A